MSGARFVSSSFCTVTRLSLSHLGTMYMDSNLTNRGGITPRHIS